MGVFAPNWFAAKWKQWASDAALTQVMQVQLVNKTTWMIVISSHVIKQSPRITRAVVNPVDIAAFDCLCEQADFDLVLSQVGPLQYLQSLKKGLHPS